MKKFLIAVGVILLVVILSIGYAVPEKSSWRKMFWLNPADYLPKGKQTPQK